MALMAPTRQPSAITPLKRMIMGAGDPTDSVVPVLENWVQEGNEIEHSQLQKLTRNLRMINRSNHALQMLEWMGEKGGYELSAADFAVQLELTSRVHGIEQAVTYFDAIPNNLRGYEVYCALLSSYAHHDCLVDGEATIQKLRELGFVRDVSAYNVMLNFYYETREYDKMNILAEEMREEGISYDKFTYNLLLQGNGDYILIKKMEKVLAELEADRLVKIDWYHYLLAAKGFWISGAVEKALTMLKKSEEAIEGSLNWFPFERLITLYGKVGSKADVYRLWSLYKPKERSCYRAYSCMIASLVEVEDPDGAARIWEEWFSKYSRIPNAKWEERVYFELPLVLIVLFGRKLRREEAGMNLGWEKAEEIVFRLRESGIEPDAATLDELATLYCRCKQMDKAVETLMKAVSVSKPGWEPTPFAVGHCLDYLEGQGDGAAREELSRMLKEHRGVSAP